MKTELRPTVAIKPYEKNPRHNDSAVDAVCVSIKQFGFRQPIVIDGEGVIVVGHTRWKAAQKLGLDKVPVHVAKDLSPEQARAYRIADNKTNEIAEWDLDLLATELGELKGLDFDLSLLGFDEDELNKFLRAGLTEGLVDADEIPEPPDNAITQRGDLWILGEHRLFCGDSSSVADLDRLLNGVLIHLINSDPPYNVKCEPRSANAVAAGRADFAKYLLNQKGQGKDKQPSQANHQGFDEARKGKRSPTHRKLRPKDRPLENDFISAEDFEQQLEYWFANMARVLLPGRAFYIWGGWTNVGNYPPVLKRVGLFWHQQIIWAKNAPVLCRKDFMLAHEWCFYGWREGAGHEFFGANNIRDVWQVDKVPQQKMVHLTEKPVELAIRALQYSSRPGENVLDLFGGSGSTLIAAEQTGRKAFLMELDPLYCDVIVQRYEKFTGKKAERISVRSNAPDDAEALTVKA